MPRIENPNEGEYLAEVRQGAVDRDSALAQLLDEYPTAEACLNRIMHVLEAVGERDYASDLRAMLDMLSEHEGWTLAEQARERLAIIRLKR